MAFLTNQSTDLGLETDGMPSGRSMHSSVSTLGRSLYPTLPVGATVNGNWGGSQYRSLARSQSHCSAGGQSDTVFLDGGRDEPPSSPGRYSKDPTFPGCMDGDMEADGLISYPSHSLPRKTHTHPGDSENIMITASSPHNYCELCGEKKMWAVYSTYNNLEWSIIRKCTIMYRHKKIMASPF